MPGGGGDAADEARRAREEEEARKARIVAGTGKINETFGQFNDAFYDKLRKSYTDFARPQLDDQMGKAREQLTFALARGGTLDSSIRSKQSGDLQRAYDANLQDVTDTARKYETDARTGVERNRADLIASLQATGDDAGAANAALSRAEILSTPASYSPLQQLFQDFTSGLSQQAALERAEALGFGAKPRFRTGLFGNPASAVRVGT